MNYLNFYCDNCEKGPCYCQVPRGRWPDHCIQAVNCNDLSASTWRRVRPMKTHRRQSTATNKRQHATRKAAQRASGA